MKKLDKPVVVTVDMDVEKGRVAAAASNAQIDTHGGPLSRHPRERNSFVFQMKPTTTINLAALATWLKGGMDFDNSVLQSISKYNVPPVCLILTLSKLSSLN